MRKPEEYGVAVRLVQEGQDYLYEARVTELPDVRTYGETFSEAYSGAIEVIATTQRIFAEKGRAFPDVEPVEDEFSGRVTLRMSKSLSARWQPRHPGGAQYRAASGSRRLYRLARQRRPRPARSA